MNKLAFDAAVLRQAGIHFMHPVKGFQTPEIVQDAIRLALDAQPSMVTTPNSGVLQSMLMYVDPKLIEVIVTPMKAAEVFGEIQKGDWTTTSAAFPMVEATGHVTAYGDFSNGGSSGVNFQFPQRQPFHYQTTTRWGERDTDIAAAARINWINQMNRSSALNLNKFQNKSYLFGVSGLQNYGILNDPSLSSPTAVGGNAWSGLDGAGVYERIRIMYKNLQAQLKGTIDASFKGKLIMSPTLSDNLNKTNTYNVNVTDQLKKNFPNLSIHFIPEYATSSGELVQMIVDEIEGQKTVDLAFTEKMRAHALIQKTSSWEQKKSQGTFGAIIYLPVGIVGMYAS